MSETYEFKSHNITPRISIAGNSGVGVTEQEDVNVPFTVTVDVKSHSFQFSAPSLSGKLEVSFEADDADGNSLGWKTVEVDLSQADVEFNNWKKGDPIGSVRITEIYVELNEDFSVNHGDTLVYYNV
jgi:hypothetical protein